MTDEMYLAREPMPLPSGQNLPRLRGSQRDARQFGEHITAGFSDAWAALQTSKAEVSRILWKHSECRVRVIFRSTYEYAFILRESNHPYHLGDAIDRDRYFDQMWESVAEDPKRRQLYLAEREDLWRGDIPIFISRPGSTSLWTSTGEEFRHFFDTSGIQAAERRLDSLNQDNLSRQLQFIDVSLSSAAASQDPPHNRWQPQCDSFESPLVAATAIAGHLAREAFTSEGQAAWVTTNELAPGFAPVVHGRDLYAGAPGVVLFLAYASQVTRIPQYADMARAGLKSLLATNGGPVWIPNGSCGSLDGIGGTVYSLTHVSALLEDEPLLDVVETCLREAEGLVSPNMEVDVFGGAAGCVLAALASHAFTGSDTALRVARLYGDVVRNALMGQGWSSDAEIARLIAGGFAHGPLGLLYALHQLGRKLGGSYAEAAAMVVDDLCGIPTERLEIMLSDLPASWCRGSSGCITALMRILPYPLGSWLSVHALVTARSEKELVASDCLCHGEMGNIEPLLEARRWFSGERWTEAVSIQGSQLLQRAATNGWTCGGRAENPGLMVGLGGIGLQLLRMDRPDQVPSVLLLDPPPGVEEIP